MSLFNGEAIIMPLTITLAGSKSWQHGRAKSTLTHRYGALLHRNDAIGLTDVASASRTFNHQ
ncbi:hypothetical protein [Alteromonas oceanisediminis]|uniref:hypothetical protein n=1 Tax=Alteromonas oceanisediminis TaxID=2836180 RepID=UPI001BDB2320|nr:hypothetical protein [Alteromonas oceanisediminis]MBT0585200.1 hypothetical protein [Alteromonas oceanisediminis]